MDGLRYPLPRLADRLREHCGKIPADFSYTKAYRLACDGKLPVTWVGNRLHVEERDIPEIAAFFGHRRTVTTTKN